MDIEQTIQHFESSGVFDFDVYPSGMFPAIGKGSATETTSGYRAAWVRDNVHVAYAHYVCGRTPAAVRCLSAVLDVYLAHTRWFTDVVEKRKSASTPMHRPHIRFDGETGRAIREKWPHAQNDALGAFMWLLCRLLLNGDLRQTASIDALLTLMVRYLDTICFYQDEDSGHWEETRKVSASSIGVVCAGLREYIALCNSPQGSALPHDTGETARRLLGQGQDALKRILPCECIQADPRKHRRYDAALLFLIDPFDIVDDAMAMQIMSDVAGHLQGDVGIRRYLLDSYWGPDYRTVPAEKRTVDLSDDIIQRDSFAVEGLEAQWCIFDSVLSICFGKLYQKSGDKGHLDRQMVYFRRAVAQLVESNDGSLVIPEAYCWENGALVPNDHVPLLWAHANLWRAVHAMRQNLNL